MSDRGTSEWTEADFETMSWHDNAVHGLEIVEGEHGRGLLRFDLDYIVEWVCSEDGSCAFRVAPAILEFREVCRLKVHLDYEAPTAALVPFSLDRIERTSERRERYVATVWTLVVSWPVGEISFEAAGFRQRLRKQPVLSDAQWLAADARLPFG